MAENFRLQRVRSFYPLAGTGTFISNSSDSSISVRPNTRRPYTGGFQVSSAKTHDRADMHLSKRVSTAVDFNRRRPNRELPRATTLGNSQMDATSDQQIVMDPAYKSPYKTSTTSIVVGDSARTSESPVVLEPEITRPKRTITVIIPSTRISDDEDDVIATDTCGRSHASLADAEQDSPLRNGATNTKQHLPNDNNSKGDQRSVATSGSNDHTRLDQSDRKKSAVPVYKIKYVHFDKNRAAVGHARQIANRLYAINVQRQSSALKF